MLVTQVRPKFFLGLPEFKKANKRVEELSRDMIIEFKAHAEKTLPNNLLGDIMRAHIEHPDLVPETDLSLLLTGPYVAGLDTVANTLAAAVYGILRTPGVLERVQEEADALMAKKTVTEDDIRELTVIGGCLREAMRMWPIAVAQMRTLHRISNLKATSFQKMRSFISAQAYLTLWKSISQILKCLIQTDI